MTNLKTFQRGAGLLARFMAVGQLVGGTPGLLPGRLETLAAAH